MRIQGCMRYGIGFLLLCCIGGLLTFGAPADELRLPPFERHKLDNGLILILMEQRELPLISIDFIIGSGSILDPAGKEGTAALTAELLRKGTDSRSADEISAQLDFIGARFGIFARLESTQGFAEFLRKDLDTGLDLLSDILRHPSFPEDEVKKLVEQEIGAIRSSKDQPLAVLGRYFYSFLYGRHPYHRPVDGDEHSLTTIRRSDILDFYRVHYTPSNLIMAVVGDFDSQEMKKAVEARLGNWTGSPAPRASVAKKPAVKGKRLLLVDKPDSTQTFFVIGNVGVERKNPDRVALEVVNTLFGGRFTSMLNSRLRIESGLTYGARSQFDEYRQPGAFRITTYTPTETTEQAIDMSLATLRDLHEKGIDEQQLTSAKNYIKGQFPPEIETTSQLANLLTELEFYGLGRDEVDDFYTKVDALTVEDVRQAIARHFPLNDLVFTVIGKADAIGDLLQKYAPEVQRRSISDEGF